jgi:hypothetical protein
LISLFGPKLPIDRDELDWQFASFKWLIEEFGPIGQDSALVLPTDDWFAPSRLTGHARASELFEQVRRHAGLGEWECELLQGESSRPVEAGNAHLLRHEGPAAPAGTFETDPEREARVVITYNPDLLRDPAALVATFAHELSHYLMFSARTAPPGGWDLHELHTDLCAVYLGFGIFLANSARNFSQFQSATESGWSASAQGYLSEPALVTAIASFQRLAGREAEEAAPYLKKYLQTDLRKAARALARLYPDLPAAVMATDLDEFVRE